MKLKTVLGAAALMAVSAASYAWVGPYYGHPVPYYGAALTEDQLKAQQQAFAAQQKAAAEYHKQMVEQYKAGKFVTPEQYMDDVQARMEKFHEAEMAAQEKLMAAWDKHFEQMHRGIFPDYDLRDGEVKARFDEQRKSFEARRKEMEAEREARMAEFAKARAERLALRNNVPESK